MFKNIANFSNTLDYLPLLNGVIITDLLGVLLSNMGLLKSNVLKKWYIEYNLSAIISDVTIILLVLIITKTIYRLKKHLGQLHNKKEILPNNLL
jgi:hypothetical protein